jgi:hypothetical protein
VYSLRNFLRSYDMPPAAHRGLVEDAKKRVARLEATDAAAQKAGPR